LQNYTSADSVESYVERESEIGIDLNGDGTLSSPKEYVEQEGEAFLSVVNGVYTIEHGTSSHTLKRGSGLEYTENSSYGFTHVEPTTDGYVAVLQFEDGRISLRWFDANGTLQNYTSADSVESYVERESEIGIDLNGDGELSTPHVIDTLGDTSLQLTDTGYALVIGDSSTPILDAQGNQLAPNWNFELKRFAETGASDEYVIVAEQPSDNEYEFYVLDANGAFVERIGPMSEMAAQAYELDLNVDFTGDGMIGRGTAAQDGITSELSGDWNNQGAIRGDAQGNDIVTKNILSEGTASSDAHSWVDLYGGDGDDILVGGDGENFFFGGKGDDVFHAGDKAVNGENPEDQGAVYIFDTRGSNGSPWAGVNESDGSVYVQDDKGSLMRIFLDGETGWVKDLTSNDGYGTDTLIGVDSVYIRTDGGEIWVSYDQETGGYVIDNQSAQWVEIEQNDWGLEGQINGTNNAETINAETIDITTHPDFAAFTQNDWVDIEGKGGDDTLIGHAGDGEIEGDKGNDTIDGGLGYDIASYELFDLNDYSHFLDYVDNGDGTLTITKNGVAVMTVQLDAQGNGTVTDLRSGPENLGTDTLSGIESIEIEGTVDWLGITVDAEGNYQVAGTKYPYSESDSFDQGWTNGYLQGTEFDDVLEVNSESGFDPSVFDENSHVSLWAGGGNDDLTGHAGGNWMSGGAGDDLMDGGAGSDTADYTTIAPQAYESFFGQSDGFDFWYREETDGSLTVYIDDQDLYNINLAGEGWVEDKWAGDGDTGRDTLLNMESVFIHIGTSNSDINISLEYDPSTGQYFVYGGERNVVYAESWGNGGGNVYGSNSSELLDVSAFSEVDSTDSNAYIYIQSRGGDDELIGGVSHDEAYYVADYDAWFDLLGSTDEFGDPTVDITEFNYRDNGDGSITVFAEGIDLYRVALDADGYGYVDDLWAADGDLGRDTLSGGIDGIEIQIPHGSMLIERSLDGDYSVMGKIRAGIQDYTEVVNNGDGTGEIIGSDMDDMVIVDNYGELDLTTNSTVTIDGDYGNDTIEGHAGTDIMVGGAGNDVMDGAGGQDKALFNSQIWDGSTTAPQLDVAVNGSLITISNASAGDLYRVDLMGQQAVDSVGDTAETASTALSSGNAVRSSFETEDDVDTFAVSVEAGQTYIVRGTADYSEGEGTTPWILGIGDGAGAPIGNWFYASDASGEYVEFTSFESGTAYISVQSNEFMSGDYSLEVLPLGTEVAGSTVEVPSNYREGVSVEDVSAMEHDLAVNTEHFNFSVDNGTGQASDVDIAQTDTGYDILVNGVKQDEAAVA